MSAWDGINRRKFPRVKYPCLVTIRDQEEKEAFLTHTENVGVGGVCIIFKKNLRLFSPVSIELDILDMGEHISCSARVVWSIRRTSETPEKPFFYDIGIEFVDLAEIDRLRIQRAIARLVRVDKKAQV